MAVNPMYSLRRIIRRPTAGPERLNLPVNAMMLCAVILPAPFATGDLSPRSAGAAAATTLRQPRLDPDLARLAPAREAVRRGRYEEGERLLAALAARDPRGEAALELGLLQLMRGRRDEASRTLERVLDGVGAQPPAEVLTRAGRAASALGQFREANTYFRQAASLAPDDPAVNVAWGELFLEKYNRQDAAQSFQTALKADASSARAHVGLARAVAEDNPPAALALAQKAIAIEADHVPAHVLMAELQLDEGRRPEARASLDQALAVNPSSLEARSVLAGMAYVEDRVADFEAEVARVLEINPRYGEVYRVAGDQAARNYRFEEAAELARRALELDPDNVRASADIGMHLLRTGDEPGARLALERAFERDPYDVVTYNLLGLLDTLDKFETVRDGIFEMKFHADEVAVMREYALPLAKQAMAELSRRYQFTPQGPILIEMFPRHDDFAVRNLGLPGMIGALGACFGRVVTLDSPRARPPGTFNWEATLWHELAHVVSLQMSKQRVPRWLTEGISVYEENRARREWGREMELTFAVQLERNEILKLKDLNSGFTNPQTISLAYYEASLLVDHIVERFGEPKLHALLRAFGAGQNMDEALTSALGVDVERLQTTFDLALERRFGALKRAVKMPEGIGRGASVESLRALASANPESYAIHVALGQALWRTNDRPGAFAALERAASLVPFATGKDSPHALMASMALQMNDKPRAIAELEALLVHDHTDVEAARRLASLIDPAVEPVRAAAALERVISIDPFDVTSHAALGRLALARRDAATAAREFRVALAVGSPDAAALHCDLAESYLLAGRADDAKKHALQALELAPAFERAQDLLLRIAEKGA
jgi:tetratricopeptide (TPR) repeat protein